ncbi:MAG: acetylglutamate kinase, partial [Chitinophagia bacterium]|nr:acetylglutamate kinase [Chitinophagia bacterium]
SYRRLREEGRIFAGMIPKLDNAFDALRSGVRKVAIGQAESLQHLLAGKAGTTLTLEPS